MSFEPFVETILENMFSWLPIEQAEPSFSPILATDGTNVLVAEWLNDQWEFAHPDDFDDHCDGPHIKPTHWRPIPPLPSIPLTITQA